VADAKVSALPSAGTLSDTDLLLLINGGGSTSLSLNALDAYIESRGRVNNASVAQQTWAATEAYLTGSDCQIPAGRLQAKTMYRCKFELTKTSTAGVATPIVNVKIGTAGTTADTTRAALTFAAQTAVADTGFLEVFLTFRTVGSGTSAVIRVTGTLSHALAATGLSTANQSIAKVTSSGFDSTVSALKIGCTFTGGTSFTGTTDQVQAELFNLA
jgi:hypothetical protein